MYSKIINYEVLQFIKVSMEGGDEADLNEEEKVPVKVRLENKICFQISFKCSLAHKLDKE